MPLARADSSNAWAVPRLCSMKAAPKPRPRMDTSAPRDLLGIFAFHERDVGPRFSSIQCRHDANGAIAAVRLRGIRYGLFERQPGIGHGFALFLGVFQVIWIRDLLRLLDGTGLIIDD